MTDDKVDPIDFLVLRADVDALMQLSRRPAKVNALLPGISGKTWDEKEAVEVGDILRATLGAIASGTGRLRANAVALDLGSDPITMRFAGDLVNVSPGAAQIFIRVKPEGRARKDGRQKKRR